MQLRLIISIILTVFAADTADAQVLIGVKIGGNTARLEHENKEPGQADRVFQPNYRVDVSAKYRALSLGTRWLRLDPRLDISLIPRGTEVKEGQTSLSVVTLDYIDYSFLPLNIEFSSRSWQFHGTAGWTFSWLRRARNLDVSIDEETDIKDSLTTYDHGPVVGVSVSRRVYSDDILLGLELKYEHGLRNIVALPPGTLEPSTPVFKNRTFSAVFGAMYEFGGYHADRIRASFHARHARTDRARQLLVSAVRDNRTRAKTAAVDILLSEPLSEHGESNTFANSLYTWLSSGGNNAFALEVLDTAAERAFAAEDFRRSAALDRVVRDESDVTSAAANQRRRVEALLALEAWDDVLADARLLIERYGGVPRNLAATRTVIERALLALAGKPIVERALAGFADLVETYARPTTVAGVRLTASDAVVALVYKLGQQLNSTDGPQALPRFVFVLGNYPRSETARSAAGTLLDTLDRIVKAGSSNDWEKITRWLERAEATDAFSAGTARHRLRRHLANARARNAPAKLVQEARKALEENPEQPGRAALFYEAIAAFHEGSDVHEEALYRAGDLRARQGKALLETGPRSQATIAHFDAAVAYLRDYHRLYANGKYAARIPLGIGYALYERWYADDLSPDERRAQLTIARDELEKCVDRLTRCGVDARVEFHARRARIALLLGESARSAVDAALRNNKEPDAELVKLKREVYYQEGVRSLAPLPGDDLEAGNVRRPRATIRQRTTAAKKLFAAIGIRQKRKKDARGIPSGWYQLGLFFKQIAEDADRSAEKLTGRKKTDLEKLRNDARACQWYYYGLAKNDAQTPTASDEATPGQGDLVETIQAERTAAGESALAKPPRSCPLG